MECNQNTQFQENKHFVVIKNYVYKYIKQMDFLYSNNSYIFRKKEHKNW